MYATMIKFFIKHLDNKDNPQENSRGSLKYLFLDLFDEFATPGFEITMQIIGDILGMAFLAF